MLCMQVGGPPASLYLRPFLTIFELLRHSTISFLSLFLASSYRDRLERSSVNNIGASASPEAEARDAAQKDLFSFKYYCTREKGELESV